MPGEDEIVLSRAEPPEPLDACDDCRFLKWKMLGDPQCRLGRRLPTYGDLQYRDAELPKRCAKRWFARLMFRT